MREHWDYMMKRIADFMWAPGPPRIVYILLVLTLIAQMIIESRMTRLNQRVIKVNDQCIKRINELLAVRRKNAI